MMTHEEMVRRVAARSLRAEDDQQDQGKQGQQDQQSQQQQQALPRSGPGKMMLQKAYKALGEAIDSEDDSAFDHAMDQMMKAKGSRPNRGVHDIGT